MREIPSRPNNLPQFNGCVESQTPKSSALKVLSVFTNVLHVAINNEFMVVMSVRVFSVIPLANDLRVHPQSQSTIAWRASTNKP